MEVILMAQTEEQKKAAAEAKAAEAAKKAEEKKAADEAKAAEKKDKTVYFRNNMFAKESINYGSDDSGVRPVLKKETFAGYKRRVMGEEKSFGYLATTNPKVIEVARATGHIDEISKKEYEEETDDKNSKIRKF
jgi:hypothetical protein